MGVISVPQEVKVAASPARMFNVVALETAKIWPEIMPDSVKCVEWIRGDGSPGSIWQTTLADGSRVKNSLDALDAPNLICKYSLIEGPMLGDKLEIVKFEVKFEDSGDGGCILKIQNNYHTKAGVQITEEEIKASQDFGAKLYAATSQYLVDHPDVCA